MSIPTTLKTAPFFLKYSSDMWEVSNYNQVISFAISLGFGALYCLAYDILRGIRHFGFNGVFWVAVQDVVYFTVIAFVTFMLMLAYTCGEIRFYILFAIFLGFIICNYTLSRIHRRVLVLFLGQLVKLFGFTNRVFKRIKLKFLRIFSRILDFLEKYLKKFIKTLKNVLKRRRLVVYTKTDV